MEAHYDSLNHWRYFLALEDDLERAFRFVEFCDENLKTHSLEFSRILMMASAEVEVVAKQLSSRIEPTLSPKNMGECREIITTHFPNLPNSIVNAVNGQMTFHPWSGWNKGRPDWWQAYTDVKHSRHTKYRDGNLGNAIEAVGGLMVMTIYLYEDAAKLGQLSPNPRLFSLGAPITTNNSFYNQMQLIYTIDHAPFDHEKL
ncbi:MAG: hypothetical protein IPH40_11085 [Polaromonas sp.]|jgi:hypothetical protein|nr:hypothetical protein [Polaromonas sp.]